VKVHLEGRPNPLDGLWVKRTFVGKNHRCGQDQDQPANQDQFAWYRMLHNSAPFAFVNFRSFFSPISIQQGLLRKNGFLHNLDECSANV
jgi:hypothetical protein